MMSSEDFAVDIQPALTQTRIHSRYRLDYRKLFEQIRLVNFTRLITLSLGVLFIYSSLSKVAQPYEFLSAVYSYELLPARAAVIAAVALPWTELILGLCLLANVFVGGSLLGAVALLSLFTFGQMWAVYNGLNISCGCFGADSESLVSASTIVRTVTIGMFAFFAYIVHLKTWNTHS